VPFLWELGQSSIAALVLEIVDVHVLSAVKVACVKLELGSDIHE